MLTRTWFQLNITVLISAFGNKKTATFSCSIFMYFRTLLNIYWLLIYFVLSLICFIQFLFCKEMNIFKLFFNFLGHDGSIRLWNLENKTCIQEITAHRKKFDEAVFDVQFHPSQPYIASAGADALAKVFVWKLYRIWQNTSLSLSHTVWGTFLVNVIRSSRATNKQTINSVSKL